MSQEKYDTSQNKAEHTFLDRLLVFLAQLLVVVTFPVSICFVFKVVREYERAVIFRLGRIVSRTAQGPGLFFINPCVDDVRVIDQRTISFDVPPQEVLTRDSVTIQVDAVVYYKVIHPIQSVINIDNYSRAVRLLAASNLRNSLGNRSLGDILTDRECISLEMLKVLDEATDPWGIVVERVEIKDVKLPVTMQRAMAAEAESTRAAKAKIIDAEGEEQASIALKEAAEILTFSPAAIQLRYLQTLSTVAADKNNTIIFPIPTGALRKWF